MFFTEKYDHILTLGNYSTRFQCNLYYGKELNILVYK